MKHKRGFGRHTGMQSPHHLDRPLRPIAKIALRSGLLVVVAMLLILVLLPAALAVQAASI